MNRIDRMIVAAAVCLAGAAVAGRPVAADTPDQADAAAPASNSMNDAGSNSAGAPASNSMNDTGSNPTAAPAAVSTNGQRDAQSVIASWPDKTKSAAQALIDKYGTPDGTSAKMLSWNDRDQWMQVAVFRDAVSVKEPMPHEDFLVNKISYKVPENKVGALARFDHALVVDQIRGTLAVHGDSEQNNVLALNLANEIVIGKRDVASARRFLKKTLEESAAGKSSSYTDKLLFTPSSSGETPSAMPGEGTEGNQVNPPMP